MSEELQQRAERVLERIEAEPGQKSLLYDLLSITTVPRTLLGIQKAAIACPLMLSALQPVHVYLTWLIECGAIESIKVDNENVYRTTEAGVCALRQRRSPSRITELWQIDPQYREAYLRVLLLCLDGQTRVELESALRGDPALLAEEVNASFFVEHLEETGAIEWNGGWIATELGKQVLRQ